MTRLIIILTIALMPSLAFALDIGLVGSKSWSDNDHLRNPFGGGIFGSHPLSDRAALLVEYRYSKDTGELTAFICDTYPNSCGCCPRERAESVTTLYSLDVDVLVFPVRVNSLELWFGGGPTLDRLTTQLTGLKTGEESPKVKTTKVGLTISAHLFWEPLDDLPIRTRLSLKRKILFKETATVVDEWSPFYRQFSITEVEIGASYRIF